VLGDNFKLVIARLGDQVVGCVALLRSQDSLLLKWVGLDYVRTPNTYAYHAMHTEAVAWACEMEIRRIRLGPTVYDIKRDLGAHEEPSYGMWTAARSWLRR
jgi:hypothetical protein